MSYQRQVKLEKCLSSSEEWEEAMNSVRRGRKELSSGKETPEAGRGARRWEVGVSSGESASLRCVQTLELAVGEEKEGSGSPQPRKGPNRSPWGEP